MRSTRAGESRELITTSGRPSRSRSPTARPRPRIGPEERRAGRGRGVDEPPRPVLEQGGPHGEGDAEPGPVLDVAVGLEQVEPAVAVEVGRRDPEAEDASGRPGDAQRCRGVAVCARAERLVGDRRAVEEVGDDQVRAAVAVEVAERDPHARERVAPAVERDPGGQPDLLELHPVPVLEEPACAAVVGDEDIESRVAHQVGDQDSQPSPLGQGDPGRPRDVGEAAVAVVAVEPVRLRLEVLRGAVVAAAVGGRADGAVAGSKST